jgi:putative tricarboxylic transport membrane protein
MAGRSNILFLPLQGLLQAGVRRGMGYLFEQQIPEDFLVMRRADRISGFFWLFFSAFVSVESYRLGLGGLHEPGPGFLCFWTGVAMGIMSVAILVRAWATREPEEAESDLFGKKNLLKVTFVLVALFLYAFFMEAVGFIPITLLLFLFLLGMIEKKKWGFAILVSVAVTVVSYLVFEVWLQAQLPRGILESLRF